MKMSRARKRKFTSTTVDPQQNNSATCNIMYTFRLLRQTTTGCCQLFFDRRTNRLNGEQGHLHLHTQLQPTLNVQPLHCSRRRLSYEFYEQFFFLLFCTAKDKYRDLRQNFYCCYLLFEALNHSRNECI